MLSWRGKTLNVLSFYFFWRHVKQKKYHTLSSWLNFFFCKNCGCIRRIKCCMNLSQNLLTVLCLKETVFACCEVDWGQSTQTRDIKWVSGKEAVNILSKVSRASGELSQLPRLQNAFTLVLFFWVQYKDTQSMNYLWHNRTAGHHVSNCPLPKMQTDPTPTNQEQLSVAFSNSCSNKWEFWSD